VFVDEVAVAVELDGVMLWLNVALAVTESPLSFRGSVPVVKLKVPEIA
jgi:hypothetical protein